MRTHRLTLLLIPLLAMLCLGAVLVLAPAQRAPITDLDAFVRTLPPTGSNDRAFLALEPVLGARLAIAPSVVRAIDPGFACDPSASTPNMHAATLGSVGTLQVVCGPAGRSAGVMTLRDGTTYITTCGNSAHISASLTVGSHSLHFSTGSSTLARELTHSCTGWTKLPR